MRLPSRGELRAVLAATAIVALLDISYVWVLWVLVRQKITTQQLLQSIATGLLGKGAYEGGPPTALLGAVLHVIIAGIWCSLFWLILSRAPRLRAVASRPTGLALVGLGYGMLIWWCMDLVVLPLSRARPVPVESWTFAVNTVQHAIMIGLPIALIIGTTLTAGPRPSHA
jgi:hypothetical protein